MPKLPAPPDHLAVIRQIGGSFLPGRPSFVSTQGGPHPGTWNSFRFYGPLNSRFDPTNSLAARQQRGVLYGANNARPRHLPSSSKREEPSNVRHRQTLVGRLRLSREVRLLDLTGLWPTRAGASMTIASGPRPRARAWTRAIYAAYSGAEGLWYGSSMHANTPCAALFERAQGAVPRSPAITAPGGRDAACFPYGTSPPT